MKNEQLSNLKQIITSCPPYKVLNEPSELSAMIDNSLKILHDSVTNIVNKHITKTLGFIKILHDDEYIYVNAYVRHYLYDTFNIKLNTNTDVIKVNVCKLKTISQPKDIVLVNDTLYKNCIIYTCNEDNKHVYYILHITEIQISDDDSNILNSTIRYNAPIME